MLDANSPAVFPLVAEPLLALTIDPPEQPDARSWNYTTGVETVERGTWNNSIPLLEAPYCC